MLEAFGDFVKIKLHYNNMNLPRLINHQHPLTPKIEAGTFVSQ